MISYFSPARGKDGIDNKYKCKPTAHVKFPKTESLKTKILGESSAAKARL